MLTSRIIACLDVKDGVVVKGVKFKNHEVVGEILPLVQYYRDQGVDELVFYDISASPSGRRLSSEWVERIAKILDIPFCVAGGIRSIRDAEAILALGADKISINSPALENPQLIEDLARRFGSQCVVVGIDSRKDERGVYKVHQYTGSESKIRSLEKTTLDWIHEVQERGAGEIVLNCMDADGTGEGYDIPQLKLARSKVTVPLIASGGAKSSSHFLKVFQEANVNGALAAGAFHRKEISIPALKDELRESGILIRRKFL